jgi:hypothetical protein
MYAGAPDHVVPAYLDRRPDLTSELDSGLDTFVNVRWAVQASYFAWRTTTNVLTGISGPADNLEGLSDAREALTGIR